MIRTRYGVGKERDGAEELRALLLIKDARSIEARGEHECRLERRTRQRLARHIHEGDGYGCRLPGESLGIRSSLRTSLGTVTIWGNANQ